MKTLSLIILTAALGAGCGKQENAEAEKPQKLIVNPIIEKAIKDQLGQPPDELTEGDLTQTQITDAGLKEVAKFQQLTFLDLSRTQFTDAAVAELKKALPNCNIDH